jgi:hypothetical protein
MRFIFFTPPFIPPYIPPHVYKYYFLQNFKDIEKLKKKYPYIQYPGPYITGDYSFGGTITPTGPVSPAAIRPPS